jgi:hypothetical protein
VVSEATSFAMPWMRSKLLREFAVLLLQLHLDCGDDLAVVFYLRRGAFSQVLAALGSKARCVSFAGWLLRSGYRSAQSPPVTSRSDSASESPI